MEQSIQSNKQGQSIIELMLVIFLMIILLPVILYGFMNTRSGKAQQQQRIKAIALLKQAGEAVRTVRESGWNNLPENGNYYAFPTETTWSLIKINPPETTALINDLNEQINLSDVYRNANGSIAQSGVFDPSTKKVTITISWSTPIPSSVSSIIYLSRLDNIARTYTTHLDTVEYLGFDSGNSLGTDVVDTLGSLIPDDAQIQLAAGGGGGDWCDPSKSITEVDLPKSGVANAISAIEGVVFAGTGENSAGVSFAKVSFTSDEIEPVVTPIPYPTFDGYKTNAVFGEDNYAYLATDNNQKEIVIIDLNQFSDPPTNLKFKEIGVINIPGNVNAISIYVTNNTAYVTSNNNKLYIYDITDRTSPILKNSTDGLNLDGTGKKVLVTGDYAYIAIDSSSYQFEIINISDPANPYFPSGGSNGKLNLNTGQSGIDIYVNTTISNPENAYLVVNYLPNQKNFYVINVTDKSTPVASGAGYDTNGMSPSGLTVVTGNIGIIVGSGGTNQYQVVRLDSMTSCGGLQYETGIRGVSSVLQSNGYAYSYIITGDASAELKIILGGGQGGGGFTTSGIYTSNVLDTGYSTAFNRFFGTTYLSGSSTTLEMQVSVSDTIIDCNDSNITYIGPDPNDPTNSRFTLTNGSFDGLFPYISLDNYSNPGRYFCYKLYLNTSDSNLTPIFHDLLVNYSP